MNDYRYEIKYLISNNDFDFLKHNLNTLLKKDSHCIGDYYTISSLYFDDYNKTSYKQVSDGISERWKYRIRFYNHDDSYISLEKKYKVNGMTNKKSIKITREIFDLILSRNIKVNKSNDPLLNELILKMNTKFLKPIILIEYDRIPYTYKLGNVRITLDYNIRYTNKFTNLFDSTKKVYYLNEKILEVKYNNFIPDFIRYKIKLNHLEQTSFSKFNNSINDLNRRF